MVSEEQRKFLRESILDADMQSRYWSSTASVSRVLEQWIATLALIATSGAFLLIATELGGWWLKGVSLAAVFLTAFPIAFRLGGAADRCSRLSSGFYRVMVELEALQRRVQSGAVATFGQLEEEMLSLVREQDALADSASEFIHWSRRVRRMQDQVVRSRHSPLPIRHALSKTN